VVLIFFIRLAPASWTSIPNPALSTLNVILEQTRQGEPVKPASIDLATPDNTGSEKVGVNDTNKFQKQVLSTPGSIPVQDAKTDIPKILEGNQIMTVKKSSFESAILDKSENVPELLVTQEPPANKPDKKDETFAPAPGVAKPVKVSPPPSKKLVSAEPTLGEPQEKIVLAQLPQAESSVKPVATLEPSNPVKPVAPVAVKPSAPEPVKIEEIKPLKIEEPKPVEIIKVKPVEIEHIQSKQQDKIQPVQKEVSAPPLINSDNNRQSDKVRTAPLNLALPSLYDFNLRSPKTFGRDEVKKNQLGERRKTITIKEQELRYSLYVESVRQKLQRIGQFNYPNEAAKHQIEGTLSLTISIRADGSLEDLSITNPSQYEVLNKGAERIVKMSAPFSPLPDNIKKDTDVLSIKINWTFSQSKQSFD
jgi:protein TonB